MACSQVASWCVLAQTHIVGEAHEQDHPSIKASYPNRADRAVRAVCHAGGAAILLLTKLGGYLFDSLSTGAPFYMMAIFNAVLLVVGAGAGIYREVWTKNRRLEISRIAPR